MNIEQKRAFDLIAEGRSVFITGSAGCGKSFLIKHISRMPKRVVLTASTGCAATLINGQTIHSFLHLGLGYQSAETIAHLHKNLLYSLLSFCNILVIDEISMINAETFNKISKIMSLVLNNPRPFGGMQMVLCGDFAQLEPVTGEYAFCAEEWARLAPINILLTKQMRQVDDILLFTTLEQIRIGKLSPKDIEFLTKLKDTTFPNDGIMPTIIYPMCKDTQKINDKYFEKLKAPIFEYKDLKLCVGAQVLLTYNINIDLGLCNGARGVVVSCQVDSVNVKFTNGVYKIRYVILNKNKNKVTVMPLMLAWAMTIHKCQGMTLTRCIVRLQSWANGQAYTALSRVKDKSSIKIIGDIKEEYFKTSNLVLEFLATFEQPVKN